MRPIYIWQHKDWPAFAWDDAKLSFKLGRVRCLQGKLVGRMSVLGFDLKNSAMLDTLTADITKSSEIEGEILNIDQVRSSVARHLGIETEGLPDASRIRGNGERENTLSSPRIGSCALPDGAVLGLGKWQSEARSGSESCYCPPMVCHYSPL